MRGFVLVPAVDLYGIECCACPALFGNASSGTFWNSVHQLSEPLYKRGRRD